MQMALLTQKPQTPPKVCYAKVPFFVFFLSFFLANNIFQKRFKYSSTFYHETDGYHTAEL